MTHPVVIFDLDGTLLDTLRDIADATNHALDSLGQPTHPVEAYRAMVGHGADVLAQRALADDRQHLAEAVRERFVEHYHRHMFDHTAPYPGVQELLDALAERGVAMAVLSNKPHEATVAVVEHLLGRWPWRAIAGHRQGVPKKPDPTAALMLAEALGAAPRDCLFVGDSEVDMQTARAAGMIAIGATWGFRSVATLREAGADRLIAAPRELLTVMSDAQNRPEMS